MMPLGLDLKTWLGLSVLAAMISAIGSIAGVALKEHFFSRSFERWKIRHNLEQIYEKYRAPLVLSARELALRLCEILDDFPPTFLREVVAQSQPLKQISTDANDPYFQRYKLTSTLYRFSSFFGWLELHRQEITFFSSAEGQHELSRIIALVRGDLADGHLNEADDWDEWCDRLVFREELRAIGESMIELRGSTRTIIGYGKFQELVEGQATSSTKHWAGVIMNFLMDLSAEDRDFRRNRLERLFVHLSDLVRLLDRRLLDARLRKLRNQLIPKVNPFHEWSHYL